MVEIDGSKYYPDQTPTYTIYGGSVYGNPPQETLEATNGITRGGCVLELGCGDARVTIPMLREGYDVVAADYNDQAIKVLKKKAYIEDIRISAGIIFDTTQPFKNIPSNFKNRPRITPMKMNAFGKFPFPDGLFDGVVSTAFFYLFPEEDIQKVVDESRRVLKPDGEGTIVFDFLTDRKIIPYHGEKGECADKPLLSYTRQEGEGVIGRLLAGKFGEPKKTYSKVEEDRPRLGHKLQAGKITVSAKTK
jgi:ubiquinone/menaquinone biosynthesis C-methylase UbiE